MLTMRKVEGSPYIEVVERREKEIVPVSKQMMRRVVVVVVVVVSNVRRSSCGTERED